ncbi:MAG: type II toxin-antitoxin system RelE/ParE family toxin [Rhizobiaceae bacterium]
MIVVFSAEAETDLEAIGDYIAKNSPRRALTFIHELKAHAARIADMPLGYGLVPRYEQYGIHRCVHGNYLIFFKVDSDRIEIVHILHGAMDYAAILYPS